MKKQDMKRLKNGRYNQLFVGIVGIFLLLLSACVKDETWNLSNVDDSVDVDVEVAAPLALGEISVLEVINDWGVIDSTSGFRFDEDSLLFFEKLKEFEVVEYISVDIQDKREDFEFELPIDKSLAAGETYQLPDEMKKDFDLDIEGGVIYSGIFESGELLLNGDVGINNANVLETYIVKFPDLTKDGEVLTATLSGAELNAGMSYPLAGYTAVFDREKDVESIQMVISMSLTNTSGSTQSVSSSLQKFGLQVRSLEPKHIVGYLDPEYYLEKTEEVDLPLLSPEYVQDYTVFFYDPKVEIVLENNIGVPFGITFSELLVVNSTVLDSADLNYNVDTVKVGAATAEVINGETMVTPASESDIINRQNSDIHNILNRVYNKVRVSYKLIPNPDGDPVVDNFLNMDEDVQLKIKTHTIIPLYARVDNYKYNDTVDFDVQTKLIDEIKNDTAGIHNLDTLELVLNIDNRFPMEIIGQLYILDGNNVVVDSLLPKKEVVVNAAPVRDEVPYGVAKSSIVLLYGEEKLEKWKEGKKIVFDVKANSTDKSYVKIYANQGVIYTLGFYTKAKVNDELIGEE